MPGEHLTRLVDEGRNFFTEGEELMLGQFRTRVGSSNVGRCGLGHLPG